MEGLGAYGAFWRLDPSLVHLNHGSFGACPAPVLAAQDRWRASMEADATGFFAGPYFDALDGARQRLAAFVGVDGDGLVFVPNSTTGVNAVLRSVAPSLRPGDEVLTTDHAYNACRNALDAICGRAGATVVTATIPFPLGRAADAVEAVVGRAGPRTRLALVDHVTSPTALVLPVAEIVAALEPDVPVLVDGAHAPGMVEAALDRLGASFAVGNCHKWMCAPKGAAYLWVGERFRELVEPVVISHGWNGRSRVSGNRLHDLFDWTGTADATAWLAVPDAIDAVAGLHPDGWTGVRAANRELAAHGLAVVRDALGGPDPAPSGSLGSMAAVPLGSTGDDGATADRLRAWLRERHRLVVPVAAWPGPGDRLVRWSAHRYNTPEDYERLATALAAWRAGDR